MPTSELDYLSINDVSYIVLDFEAITHKGQTSEPVEIGAMRIIPPGIIDNTFKIDELIQLPNGIHITPFFTANTGIRAEDLKGKPFASEVLRQFNEHFQNQQYVVVAQNAHYDAAIISRFADVCVDVAQMPFIDTIALAKSLIPKLQSYKLDALARHFLIPIPENRHRALVDVKLTCEVFLRLLNLWKSTHKDNTFYHLRRVAGITIDQSHIQASLFD